MTESSDVIVPVDPSTGRAHSPLNVCDAQELERAIEVAAEAGAAWAARDFEDRALRLQAFAERIGSPEIIDELADLICSEMGKPLPQARSEVAAVASRMSGLVGAARAATATQLGSEGGVEVEVQWRPRGVVGVIGPWNYPVSTPNHLILAAIVTGNSVVWKPSEQTPRTGLRYTELLAECLPKGLVHCLVGGPELGRAICSSRVSMIAFTGSVETGRRIMRAAAEDFKGLVLEMGGKDPMILLPGTDVSSLASTAVRSSLSNSGQVCVSTERIFVHEDQEAQLLEQLQAKLADFRVGDPRESETDMGPMSSELQRTKVLEQIEAAREAGAQIVVQGEASGPGFYLSPTLVAGVNEDMAIARDETFGPVISVSTYRTVDELVERVNAGEFGLGGSVWGPDDAKARAVAERLEIGMIGVNRGISTAGGAPWVGWKHSGFGYARSVAGMQQFMRPRSIARTLG